MHIDIYLNLLCYIISVFSLSENRSYKCTKYLYSIYSEFCTPKYKVNTKTLK